MATSFTKVLLVPQSVLVASTAIQVFSHASPVIQLAVFASVHFLRSATLALAHTIYSVLPALQAVLLAILPTQQLTAAQLALLLAHSVTFLRRLALPA